MMNTAINRDSLYLKYEETLEIENRPINFRADCGVRSERKLLSPHIFHSKIEL